jgi:hypothetical protein
MHSLPTARKAQVGRWAKAQVVVGPLVNFTALACWDGKWEHEQMAVRGVKAAQAEPCAFEILGMSAQLSSPTCQLGAVCL